MKIKSLLVILCTIVFFLCTAEDCSRPEMKSSSGIKKAEIAVTTGSDGLTTEQSNIGKKYVEDNS